MALGQVSLIQCKSRGMEKKKTPRPEERGVGWSGLLGGSCLLGGMGLEGKAAEHRAVGFGKGFG